MVRERCVCGAEFESDNKQQTRLLREWRATHRCQLVPPGLPSGAESKADVASPWTDGEMRIGFQPDEE